MCLDIQSRLKRGKIGGLGRLPGGGEVWLEPNLARGHLRGKDGS